MIYLIMLLGMLLYLIIDLATYRQGLPEKTKIAEVVTNYFHMNAFYILGGAVLSFLILILITGTDSNTGIVGMIKGFFTEIGITFENGSSYGNAGMLGLLNQWLFIKLRKYFKSITYDTDVNNVPKLK